MHSCSVVFKRASRSIVKDLLLVGRGTLQAGKPTNLSLSLLQRSSLAALAQTQRTYSSADGANGLFGIGAGGMLAAAGSAAVIGAGLERPHSASSAAEEDVHRRLAHLGTGFGPGFF